MVEERGAGDEVQLSEAEVRSVLARAAEIEVSGVSSGLTVSELHDVARQVGIPSAALSRALRELAYSSSAQARSRGGWVRHRETAFVSGHVSDDDIGWLLRLLDQLGQIRGGARLEHGAIQWTTPEGPSVEIMNRPHETYVSVEIRDGVHLARHGVGFIGAGVAIGTAFALVGVDAMPPSAASALGALGGSLSFGLYWRIRREKIRAAITKTAAGVSEVVRMVARRGEREE